MTSWSRDFLEEFFFLSCSVNNEKCVHISSGRGEQRTVCVCIYGIIDCILKLQARTMSTSVACLRPGPHDMLH